MRPNFTFHLAEKKNSRWKKVLNKLKCFYSVPSNLDVCIVACSENFMTISTVPQENIQ